MYPTEHSSWTFRSPTWRPQTWGLGFRNGCWVERHADEYLQRPGETGDRRPIMISVGSSRDTSGCACIFVHFFLATPRLVEEMNMQKQPAYDKRTCHVVECIITAILATVRVVDEVLHLDVPSGLC